MTLLFDPVIVPYVNAGTSAGIADGHCMLPLTGPATVFWATGAWVAVLTGARLGIETTVAVGIAVAAEPHADRMINAITNMAVTEFKPILRIFSYPF